MTVMSDGAGPARGARVVVKVGTSSITDEAGRIDPPRMGSIARGVLLLERATGRTPVLVSSGAGAAGRARLGLSLPLTLPDKQAAAAVGQTLLMHDWERAFAPRPLAQLLLSADDVHDRARYVNLKNALQASLRLGALPIVNENDSVATQELKLGDNDTLSAWVAYLADAATLVILTDVDGLYDADPRRRSGAVRIDEVRDVGAAEALAGGVGSGRGTGGMVTKLRAARVARDAGIETWIAGGGGEALEALARGEAPGTRVVPAAGRTRARKAWLANQPVAGTVRIDAGAVRALRGGRSLLPSGVRVAEGAFGFGDAVAIVGPDGAPVGRGLVNYAAEALARIAGRRTHEIADLLGAKDFDEVVHRDNLVLTAADG